MWNVECDVLQQQCLLGGGGVLGEKNEFSKLRGEKNTKNIFEKQRFI